jgi:hypothetical protein
VYIYITDMLAPSARKEKVGTDVYLIPSLYHVHLLSDCVHVACVSAIHAQGSGQVLGCLITVIQPRRTRQYTAA